MSQSEIPKEVWQRGPIEGVPALLQPVAHALLQAGEELKEALKDFDDRLLWVQPEGVASVGFHLKHIAGVMDRLFTYAQARVLTEEQLNYLKQERMPTEGMEKVDQLFENVERQIGVSIEQLKQTDEDRLTEPRGIGRKQIPTTVLGLLFHTAEHTMRHVGQLLVTVRWVKASDNLK